MSNTKDPYWREAIKEVNFDDEDAVRGRMKESESWMSCACGKLDKRIPISSEWEDAPKDKKLRLLGTAFMHLWDIDESLMSKKQRTYNVELKAIIEECGEDRRKGLSICLDKIELRESEILKELGYNA